MCHVRVVVLAGAIAVVCGCAPAGGGGNVNAPKGNAIGDRHADFMRVVAHARTLPPGEHSSSDLPPELRIKNLITVHVGDGRVYALEFPSIPIDSDPIYVFVDAAAPDPEALVRAWCAKKPVWQFSRKLDEPGWYYVNGP